MRKLGNHQIVTSSKVKDLAGAPVTPNTVDERLMGLQGASLTDVTQSVLGQEDPALCF